MLTIEMFLHIIKSFAPKLTQNLFKVQKLIALIARCIQLTDYQHIPVQWQAKFNVTDVTRTGKVTSVTWEKQADVTWERWYSTSYNTRAMSDMSFHTLFQLALIGYPKGKLKCFFKNLQKLKKHLKNILMLGWKHQDVFSFRLREIKKCHRNLQSAGRWHI